MDALISHLLAFRPERLLPPFDRESDMAIVAWLTGVLKPSRLVELGTQSGNVYFAACQTVKQQGLPTSCVAVGTWQTEILALSRSNEAPAVWNQRHYAAFSTLMQMGTTEALPHIDDASIDLLLVDGRRTPETVRAEFAAWRGKLSPRAVVFVHGLGAQGQGGEALWKDISATVPGYRLDAGEGAGILLLGAGIDDRLRKVLDQNLGGEANTVLDLLDRARQAQHRHDDAQSELETLRARLQQTENARQQAARQLHELQQQGEAAWQKRLDEAQATVDELRRASEISTRHITELAAHARNIEESFCWRITAPIRWVGTPINLALQKALLIRRAIQVRGGIRGSLRIARAVFRSEGIKGIQRRLWNTPRLLNLSVPVAVGLIQPGEDAYHAWLRNYDPTDEEAMSSLKAKIERLALKTTFSVVMPVYNPPLDYLRQAIASVQAQVYPHWELCIADDASPRAEVRELLNELAAQDSRIRVVFREQNGHISAATNSAMDIATGEFIALMDNDDLLPPHALAYMALAVHQHPDAGIIYSDEDKVTEDNVRMSPYFKCDFNYELFLSQNMISHFGVYRRSVLQEIGGFRVGYEGAQDWDLALRVIEKVGADKVIHVPRVLYHWRVFPGSTALALEEKDYALKAQLKSISSHLERMGKPDTEVFPAEGIPGLLRIRHALPADLPRVSIVIPTRDRVELLSMCVDSILERTRYVDYEIVIVDNGSTDLAALDYLNRIASNHHIRVVPADVPFNYSQLNNIGVEHARGEYLVLMNNDIEITQPDWLEEMLAFAIQPDIGCVGAQLWYPDGTLQHGGVVLGIGGVASHAHKGVPRGNFGYFGRASAHQTFSAVTAACMMVSKAIYREVGGFDETLKVAYNDVDFCLKVRATGYRNLYNPFASFVHHESASRGSDTSGDNYQRLLDEAQIMKHRWGRLIADDPAYSPNLTLMGDDFSMAWPSRVGREEIRVVFDEALDR